MTNDAPAGTLAQYKTGRYYGTPTWSVSAAAFAADRMVLTPFPVASAVSADRISIEVTVTAAGASVRLGTYSTGTHGYPCHCSSTPG